MCAWVDETTTTTLCVRLQVVTGEIRRIVGSPKSYSGAQPTRGAPFVTELMAKLVEMQLAAEKRAEAAVAASHAAQATQEGKIRRIVGPPKACNGAQPIRGACVIRDRVDEEADQHAAGC